MRNPTTDAEEMEMKIHAECDDVTRRSGSEGQTEYASFFSGEPRRGLLVWRRFRFSRLLASESSFRLVLFLRGVP